MIDNTSYKNGEKKICKKIIYLYSCQNYFNRAKKIVITFATINQKFIVQKSPEFLNHNRLIKCPMGSCPRFLSSSLNPNFARCRLNNIGIRFLTRRRSIFQTKAQTLFSNTTPWFTNWRRERRVICRNNA